MKLYWSIIRPIVTYVRKNMGFKTNNKKQANGIRKESFKKNLVPTKERDGAWRIRTNDELDKLVRHKNIINYIKAQRLLVWPFTSNARRENSKKSINGNRC
jgi:hypothetical protein